MWLVGVLRLVLACGLGSLALTSVAMADEKGFDLCAANFVKWPSELNGGGTSLEVALASMRIYVHGSNANLKDKEIYNLSKIATQARLNQEANQSDNLLVRAPRVLRDRYPYAASATPMLSEVRFVPIYRNVDLFAVDGQLVSVETGDIAVMRDNFVAELYVAHTDGYVHVYDPAFRNLRPTRPWEAFMRGRNGPRPPFEWDLDGNPSIRVVSDPKTARERNETIIDFQNAIHLQRQNSGHHVAILPIRITNVFHSSTRISLVPIYSNIQLMGTDGVVQDLLEGDIAVIDSGFLAGYFEKGNDRRMISVTDLAPDSALRSRRAENQTVQALPGRRNRLPLSPFLIGDSSGSMNP